MGVNRPRPSPERGCLAISTLADILRYEKTALCANIPVGLKGLLNKGVPEMVTIALKM